MANQFKGEQLLGFEGRCTACGKTERAYYLFADKINRERMKDGTFMAFQPNCPACVTREFFQVARSMKWHHKLPPDKVQKDLEVLQAGINIDFKAADEEIAHQRKMNAEVDNTNARTQEYLGWKKKRN